MLAQGIQAPAPEVSIVLDPVSHFFQRCGIQAVHTMPTHRSLRHESGLPEHPEVLRERGQGDLEGLGKSHDG